MTAVTPQRVAELREASAVATPGPWVDGGAWWGHWTDPEGRLCHTRWPTVTHGSTGADIAVKATNAPDAHLIAAMRNALDDLLDTAEAYHALASGALDLCSEAETDDFRIRPHELRALLKDAQRPCKGRNANVCVAEGCYGEACLADRGAVG